MLWLIGALAALAPADDSPAATLAETIALYNAGDYDKCIESCAAAIEDGDFSETWRVLKIEAELAVGKYEDAETTLVAALERFSTSIRLRWIGRDVYRYRGQPEKAKQAVAEIEELVARESWRYRDVANVVTLGRFFLDRGADAKQVLTQVYGKIKKDYPQLPEAFLASGQLALDKHDFGMAAEAYQQAAKLDPQNPDVHFGLARAYAASDSEKAQAALEAALERNPRHIPSLLLVVDEHVDAERYDEAGKVLDQILEINSQHPLAWAYRAVLAHLAADDEREQQCRAKALADWAENPEVDYTIGRKLSQKYRFAEGAAYQRKSLAFDADYLPAKAQLCQDLLRLGEELEGWKLADEVFDADNYDVVAHNLTTLRDRLTKFHTLEAHGFAVRMEQREAKIYGDRVLELLRLAKQHLCQRYEVELQEPIYVEIFPRQQDFAIRTFGLPGGAGFLGVCFGRVITMNSPASQGDSPSNWEAVLWHEFCHVVTLTKTNNKMPRWLSEGISVYEEGQRNPAWGQSMNPRYREMILDGELTPVSQLSGAFLTPKSALHLQFAYFESALVVEYLVDKYGLDMLKRVLVDLSVGMPINDSLQRYVGSLELLDEEFESFAKSRAEALAPEADFTSPELPPGAERDAIAEFLSEHPDNLAALSLQAQRLIDAEQWEQAKKPLTRLLELYPEDASSDGPRAMLAAVHRQLEETEDEKSVLNQMAAFDADAVTVRLRLLELCAAAKEWDAMIEHAEAALAVNPLIPAPHRYLAEAAEQTGDNQRALAGLAALLEMDPFDPAEARFRVARLLVRKGDLPSARRQVLQALEEAPRYREAQKLLLEIVEVEEKPDAEEPAENMPDQRDEAKPDNPQKTDSPPKPKAASNAPPATPESTDAPRKETPATDSPAPADPPADPPAAPASPPSPSKSKSP
ncbi:MAG: tetratricopeptide repeat protein [Pirellulaceae bacterium]